MPPKAKFTKEEIISAVSNCQAGTDVDVLDGKSCFAEELAVRQDRYFLRYSITMGRGADRISCRCAEFVFAYQERGP